MTIDQDPENAEKPASLPGPDGPEPRPRAAIPSAPERAAARRAALKTRSPLIDDLITRATGKACPDQKPVLALGGLGWWAASLAATALLLWGNVALVSWMLSEGGAGLLLLPVGVPMSLLLTGRLRAQQVAFVHHAIHNAISKRWPWLNPWVAEIATVIALAQNPLDYFDDHQRKHHRWRIFTTVLDPDATFLRYLGFRPGMSRSALRRRFFLSMVSPRFHLVFAWARFRSTFITSSWTHRVLAAVWIGALILIARHVPPTAFLIGVALPIGPLYQASALCQFVTEHRWMCAPHGPATKAEYVERSIGRFCLPAPPVTGHGLRTFVGWLAWSLKMLPLLLIRASVWVGDMPAHDRHHVEALLGHEPETWTEAVFERERAITEGDAFGLATREACSFGEALDWVFAGLSNSDDGSRER